MINMGELFAYDRIGNEQMERVPLSEREQSRFLVQEGDLLFARASLTLAGAGKVSIVRKAEEQRTFESHIIRIRLDRSLADSGFYYYYFRSPQGRSLIESIVEQVSAAGIRSSDLARVLVPSPLIGEQSQIARVLGTLDDKIELNRRMNATLEAMARALFQSWFVDFDPVRAKQQGREPAGLDTLTASLFSAEVGEDDLGDIPEGWQRAAISDLCDANAWTLGKHDNLPELEYVEISEVSRGNINSLARFKRGEEPSRARRRLRHGDTVLSTVRPDRGAYFLAMNPPPHRVASTGFATFTPTKAPWSFVHVALTAPEVFTRLGQLADGGAYPAVRPEQIGSWMVTIPPDDQLLQRFHDACAPLLERAEANRSQSRTLAALRDALLPKLLSGELSVDDAARAADQ